jgi:proline-specific peptidase
MGIGSGAGVFVGRGEGYLDTRDGRLYYEIAGGGQGVPVLVLHGGPAGAHEYLKPLADMFGERRSVVLYDQLGCGRSDRPENPALWRIERFAREVQVLRDGLGLGRIHLLGQSFGGMLAIEYMLDAPLGIVSLVLADTTASMPLAARGLQRLRAELPAEARRALEGGEQTGQLDTPEYGAALFAFYQRHVCRLEEWPPELLAMGRSMMGNPVYRHMWGPNEFTPSGSLQAWDRSARLGEIHVPTLVTVGRYGEIVPECAEAIHDGIAGSERVVFEQSAHVPHLEEPERFREVVAEFLHRVEQTAP